MDVIIDRVCGVDIGKAVLAATVRTPAEGTARKRREETRKFPTFAADLDRLAEWLVAEGVTVVAMEATSDYWRPVWWVLEQAGVRTGPRERSRCAPVAGPQDRCRGFGLVGPVVGVRAVAVELRPAPGDP